MPPPKPMEIIRQSGTYFCVRSKRRYYCIQHDSETNITRAFIPSDRVLGEWRAVNGWTHDAVEHVARPHKRTTAIAYFNQQMRIIRKQQEVQAEEAAG